MPHSKIAQRKNEACALKAGDLIRKCDEDCEKFRFYKDIIVNAKTLIKKKKIKLTLAQLAAAQRMRLIVVNTIIDRRQSTKFQFFFPFSFYHHLHLPTSHLLA